MGMNSMSTIRIRINSIARFLALSIAVLALTTCDLFKSGLGSKIDVTTPTVDVSSLKNGDYINSARTLSGTAGDDVAVVSVSVAVYSGSTLVASLPASIGGSTWSVLLDPVALFPNQEVQANLVITVADDSGKTTERRLVLYFDTVKPTIGSLIPSVENLEKTESGDPVNFLSETVAFEGSVKDGFGVEGVTLTAGGVAQTSASSSWTFYVDTTTLAVGAGGVTSLGGSVLKVPFSVVAHDKAGNESAEVLSPASPATAGFFYVDQARSAPWITGPRTGFFGYAYGSGSTTIIAPGEQVIFKISDAECIDAATIEVTISDPDHLVPDFVYSIADGNMTLSALQEDGARLLKAEVAITLPVAADLAPKGLGEYALTMKASDDVDYKYPPKTLATRTLSNASLTISNAIPTVYVTTPVNGSIAQNLSMTGSIEDGVGVGSVSISIDGAASAAAALASSGAGVLNSSWTYSAALAEGSHTLDVYGYNVGGKQSAVVQRQVVIDRTGPSATVTTPEASSWQSSTPLTIRGGVEDNAGVQAVYYIAANAAASHAADTPAVIASTWTAATGTGSWNGTLDLAAMGEGAKTLWVAALDKAGNWSAPAGTNFSIDLAVPRATMSETGTFVDVAMVKSTRAAFSLGGTADDAQATAGRAASSATLAYSKDGGSATSVALTPAGDGSWSWSSSSAGLTDGTRDGLYVFTLTVVDVAGKTSTRQMVIKVDTTSPSIIVSAPVADEKTTSTTYAIAGTSRDTGGVGFDGTDDVEYQFSTEGATWHPLALTGINWGQSIALGAGEGSRILNFRSTDAVGNQASASVTFYYDLAKPTISETTVGTTDTVFRSADFSLGGAWTESNSLSAIEISYQKDGGAASTVAATLSPGANGSNVAWSATIDVDLDNGGSGDLTGIQDGSYVFTILATDAAGRTASLTRTIVIDTTDPIVTPPAPSASYVATTVSLMGTASDPGTQASGVSAVEYSLNGSTWDSVDGTTSWSKTVDLSSASEGDIPVYFRARDRAGLYSPAGSTTVKVDHSSPRATMSPTGTFVAIASVQSTRQAFSLGGLADDALSTAGRAAATSVLSYTRDGGTATNVALTPAADGSWSWSNATLTNGSNDGLYVFTLSVTDIAGKTSTSQQVVKVDTTAPTLAVSAPVPGEATALSSYAISGTSRDTGGVGFDAAADVEYQFSTEGATWHSLTLTGTSWGSSVSMGAGEGSRTLNFRSTDALGNQAAASVSFYYDLANPTLTETSVGTTDTQYRNSDLSFGGAASDSNALSSLAVSVNGGASSAITVTGGNWTYVFDADAPTSEGAYTLVFTATDAANKTTSLTRYVVVDRTAPTLSGITNLTLAWNTSSSLPVAGSAGDGTGSGLSRVEYSTDGTNYSAFTGTASFSGTVAFADGSANVLRIRAVDRAGNVSAPAAGDRTLQTVRVDTLDPTFDVTSPVATPILNGTTSLNVSITAADSTSGPATAQAKAGDSDFSTGTVYSSSAASGTATIAVLDLSSLAEGTRRVYVRVIDNAGRASSPIAVNVLIDKTNPSVTFSSHTNGTSVNKLVAFSGTSSDSNGIASCAVQVYRHDTSTWVAAPSGAASGTTSWSLASFDTAAITSASATYDSDGNAGNGLQLRVRAHATDAAGNTADEERTLLVDQAGDKPAIRLSNLATTGSGVLKQTSVIYGTVNDDDGAIASFKVSTSAVADWSSVSATDLDGNSFSYNVGGGDGMKTLYFWIQDAGGTTFVSANPESDATPRLFVSTGVYTGLPVAFRLDTTNPDIGSTIGVDTTSSAFGAASALVSGAVFGGSVTGTMYLRAEAYDANGISSVVATVWGKKASANHSSSVTLSLNGSGTPENAGYSVYQSSTGLSVTDFDDGTASLDIVVTDSSGLTSTSTKSIVIDNTAPSFAITSHSTGTVVNGELSLRGTASDGLSGLGAVYYKLGLSSGPGTWTAISSGSLYSWSVNFADIDLYADNGTVGHYTGYSNDLESDGIYYFPIMIRAVDKAGNASTATYGDFALQLDPGGDKPKVSIVYPYNPTEPLGGTVRVYGSATDDDGVYAAYMQVDVDGDGLYEADDTATADYDSNVATPDTTVDWYNAGLGRAVTGSNNWSLSINTAGEFNPTPAQIAANQTRTIHARVRAMDTKNGTSGDIYGPWVETTIQFDSNVPKIGSSQALYLYQGPIGSPTATKVYTSGMYVTGSWNLGGSVEDEGGISNIVVSGGLSANLSTGVNSSWFSQHTGGSDLRYDLAIPITTAPNASGTISFTITAYDNTSRVSTYDVKIFYDNIAPTAAFTSFDLSSKIVQSDGYYKVGGTAIDDGSDIQKVVIYFVRRSLAGSAFDRFIRPDQASSNTSYVTGSDKLATLNSGGGSVTVDFPSDANYLINVDHKGYVESHTDTSNNDADNYIEKLKQTSGDTYSWYADIVSTNIPDGPIEVHFVVYDASGNTRHYVYSGSVENNGPAVSAISLGTDLDENGTVVPAEKTSYSTPTGTTSTSFKVKAAPMSFDLSLSGGNNSVYYSLAYGATTLRPLVTTAGSFVIGATYTITSVGTTSFTSIGASANTVGTSFVATGAGSGSGTAYTTIRSGSGGSVLTISLTAAEVAAVGDGTRTFTLVLWDSTEELTPGSNSLSVTKSISCDLEVSDVNAPVAVISPFYWTNSGANSIYNNSAANGHIELTGVVNGDDPDVSGKVKVQGTGYDDQIIRRVYARIDGLTLNAVAVTPTVATDVFATGSAHGLSVGDIVYFAAATLPGGISAGTPYYVLTAPTATSFTVASTFSGSSAVDVTSAGTTVTATAYRRMATYSGGTWSAVSDTLASNGWDFSVSNTSMSQDGHQIAWTLDWDSSMISTVAATDVMVKVMTMDKAGNLSSATTVSAGDYKTVNVPSYKVDVVPYIKAISRSASFSTIRSREGRYVLRRGEAITITGFNLYYSTNSVTIGGASATIAGTVSSVTTTVPATASSGDIAYSVNGVSMPNNLSTSTPEYDSEATSNEASTLWNDDRRVHIWISDAAQAGSNYGYFSASGYPVYPAMSYNGSGTLYASWSNYSSSSTYFGSNAAAGSTTVINGFDPPEHTDIAWNATLGTPVVVYNANMSSAGAFSTTQSGGVQLYASNGPNNTTLSGPPAATFRGYRLEELYHDSMLMQFINERVATNGTGHYVSYYDTDTKAMKYAYVDYGSTATAEITPWVNMDGGFDSNDTVFGGTTQTFSGTSSTVSAVSVANGDAVVSGTTALFTTAAGGTVYASASGYVTMLVAAGNTVTNGTTRVAVITPAKRAVAAGEYSAIVLTNGHPVIAYYDATSQTVKIAHTSATGSGTTTGSTWKIQTAMSAGDACYQYSGKYISAKIDGSNYLHLVFYRTSTGDLVYLKSTNAPTDGATDYTFGSAVVIDSIGSVGAGADIALSSADTPYISYYDASNFDSFNGLKMAYYDATNSVWEYMNAPLGYNVANDSRTSIEYNTGVTLAANAASTSNTCWAAAVGYKSDDYYRVGYYVYGN